MKTISDLNALIPQLIDLVLDDPQIGDVYDPESNNVCFLEDGWCIEVSFDCSGVINNNSGDYWTPSSCDIVKAWGEVTDVVAFHYDEKTKELSDFSGDDLNDVWTSIDKALELI